MECIYTGKGRQRTVNIENMGTIAFDLKGAPEGSFIEFSNQEAPAAINNDYYSTEYRQACERFSDSFIRLTDTCGVLSGAKAIRVTMDGMPEAGFATLSIQSIADPEVGCIGQLTNMNHVLAHMNRDIRTMAVIVGA